MNEPFIDVLIAVYNGEQFIADAIRSVQAQSWKNVNIIITDDGSEDNTVPVVLEMMNTDSRIKLLQQPHTGVSAALNKAIANAKAPYITFLDADDLWHPQKLEKQMKSLAENDAEICFCLIQEFETFDDIYIPAYTARLKPMKGYAKTCFLGKSEVFKKYGLFDETISMGDFIEWFSRVIRTGKEVIMIDEILAYRRVHHTNSTHNTDKNLYLQVLKAHIDEKRKINRS